MKSSSFVASTTTRQRATQRRRRDRSSTFSSFDRSIHHDDDDDDDDGDDDDDAIEIATRRRRARETRDARTSGRRDARAMATPRGRRSDDHHKSPRESESESRFRRRFVDRSLDSFDDPALRRRAMGLEERLSDAIATENFLAAAKVRDEMRAVRRRDPRARCEDDLEEAIASEDYARAAKI